ncbi:family 20 glycosylhydrolase [Lysobacter cavernae]|uniref:beta-N-acetylhexosaminidase n=1 Tax=Lysobacter cavernae TaxID=1685901 RepID=A0ABV7RRC7_9GAMM
MSWMTCAPHRAAWMATCLAVLALGGCKARDEATPVQAPVSAAPAIAPLSLIPRPARLERGPGQLTLTPTTALLASDAQAEAVARTFADLLVTGGKPKLQTAIAAPASGAIAFVLDAQFAGASPEAYRLEVKPEGARVVARTPAGLFNGAMTLWQLATLDPAATAAIPTVTIDDAPRFGWRGFMLDSARHFQSVEEIKTLLDAMALHKLNVFHWHLTDDQGWRMEIKRYPKLTQISGCRIPAGDGGRDPASGQPRPYCGYYTQDQIREVVAYAAARHITVVPELDVPGHAQAAIAAYPELGVLGDRPAPLNEWGVNTYLFNAEDSTLVFLENVLAEMVELFPGRYVHLGGDEAVKDQWKASARVQQRIKELGVAGEEGMQSYMLKRLERFLVGHGKLMIGWDEILEGGLPPEAAVMSWRGIEGGIEAARQGHDVVMVPSSDLYLDYLQTTSPNEPPGRPDTNTLQDAYAFEPVPKELTQAQQRHILGLQANMWTEHTRTDARLEHHLYPRLAAVAETGWTPRADKRFEDFLARLPGHLHRLQALGIDYARTPFEVAIAVDDDRRAGTAQITLSNPLGYPVRYTTDGSEPGATAKAYDAPFPVKLPAQVRAAAFHGDRALVASSEFRIDAASLLSRSDEQLAVCPDAGRLLLRLEDDGPADGERAIFNVTIFYPCWQWNAADLDGIGQIRVRAGRIPYYFQLAHDEPSRTFEPAKSAHGELVVRAGGCKGKVIAEAPMPAAPDKDGFVELTVDLPQDVRGKQDLCLLMTGDTRPAMWVADRVTLVPSGG